MFTLVLWLASGVSIGSHFVGMEPGTEQVHLNSKSIDGYGKATWGMRPKEVAALYPGGAFERVQDGVLRYVVLEGGWEVANTCVAFGFDGGKGLSQVTLLFRNERAEAEPGGSEFGPMSEGSARAAVRALRADLIRQFGPPVSSLGLASLESRWVDQTGAGIELWLDRVDLGYSPVIEYGSPPASSGKRPGPIKSPLEGASSAASNASSPP